MPGRPKMMAKRAEKLLNSAWEIGTALRKICPQQYRDLGPIHPETPDELFGGVPIDQDITRHWRAVLGHCYSLESLVEELVELLREKAGLPGLSDDSPDAPPDSPSDDPEPETNDPVPDTELGCVGSEKPVENVA